MHVSARPEELARAAAPTVAMLDAALGYAARGWRVFPCKPRSKQPACAHGVKDGTTDVTAVKRWWSQSPLGNVALACGASGLLAIDVDCKNGAGGWATWARLHSGHDDWCRTLVSKTPSGGAHYIYQAPADVDLGNSAGKLGPGIDVRANGGYIVVAPSIHPGYPNGPAYEWDVTYPDPAPLPGALCELLRKPDRPDPAPAPQAPATTAPGYGEAALQGELAAVRRAQPGTRNATLNRAAFNMGQLLAGQALPIGQWQLEDGLLATALACGLTEDEARKTIASGLNGGAQSPRNAPERPATAPQDAPEPPVWLDDDSLGGALHPAQASSKKAVTLHRASEAWRPRPVAPEIVRGLIRAAALVLLFGLAGIGKTWVFMDLAVCVAAALEWIGRHTAGGAVLVIDEESGDRRIAERLERTMRGHGIAPGTDLPIFWASLEGFDFRKAEPWCAVLQDLIGQTGAGLVIVDALADVMLGGDENSVQDTQPVFHHLRSIAEATGAAIMVVHHSNKAGGYRGSTAIPGAVDLALQVSAVSEGGPLKIETVKARDIAPAVLGCRGVWDDLTQTFALAAVDLQPAGARLNKSEKYVLRYLREHGDSELAVIRANADSCSPAGARQAVYSLADKKQIERKNAGGTGERAVYGLVV